jgi:hypothetical protein
MTGQVMDINATTGAVLHTFDLDPIDHDAREVGSVTVGINPLKITQTGKTQWSVFFGAIDPDGGANTFYVLDGRTFSPVLTAAGPIDPGDGFVGATALGMPEMDFNTKIYTTTEHGGFIMYA